MKKNKKVNDTPTKPTSKKDIFLEIFEKTACNISEACKHININRATYYDWYNNDNDFKQSIDNLKEGLIDYAESQLMRNISNGDNSSIMFFLKCQGKSRGYVEKVQTELSTSKSDPVVINYVMPSVNNSNKQD